MNKLIRLILFKIDTPIANKIYIKLVYKRNTGEKLDLRNPKNFNEKIQWLKLNDHKDIYTTMVDKLQAKEYVKEKIGTEYLTKTIAVVDDIEKLDIKKLPNKFVIKNNYDSGGIYICKDKNSIDLKELKKIFGKKRNYFYYSREWVYKKIKPLIFVEEYIEHEDDLKDYKLFCFDGKVKYIQVDNDRYANHTRNFYDLDWNYCENVYVCYPTNPTLRIGKPKNFKKMIEIAEILSKDTLFLRVDLYNLNGIILFGEMTFYPGGV